LKSGFLNLWAREEFLLGHGLGLLKFEIEYILQDEPFKLKTKVAVKLQTS